MDVIRELTIENDDFAWEPEITAKLARRGIGILEIPISYSPRRFAEGKKLRWSDGVRALATTLRYGLLVACLFAGACRRGGTGPAAPAIDNDVIAKVGETEITVADFEDHLNKQAAATRAHYSAPENRNEYLDQLVRFEVLAQEAKARGYEKDPDVQRIVKQQMIELLVAREVESKVKSEDVPNAEVEAYYQAHTAEFARPEEGRAGVTRPFAEVQAEIRRRLYLQLRAKRLDELRADLQNQIRVETFPDRLGKAALKASDVAEHVRR